MNKPTKISLRLWIAASSIGATLLGWVLLAHAEKPAALVSTQSSSTSSDVSSLPPIPSLEELTSNQSAPSFSTPRGFGSPRLRTMGS